ncbi:carbohydrate sulfotransferase 15-like isoform 2-T3 [Polymixia lowei]
MRLGQFSEIGFPVTFSSCLSCPHVNMLLSDCKYGGTPNKYSFYSLSNTDDSRKRPAMPCPDFSYKNFPETLDVKWVPLKLLSRTNLRSITKVKVVSFLLGLTLTFFIMASYILTWDRKGLLFTPSPFQLKPMVVTASTAEPSDLSSENNFLDMKLLVRNIISKLEYTPRDVPDKSDVIGTDSQLFSVIPQQFLPEVKSPCWYEEFSGNTDTDPYRTNMFTLRSKSFRTVCDYLRTNFQEHLCHRDGKQYRLRCLPYFYIIGQPKCGTTDLFHRLLLHPEVKFTTMKEPHWWTRKRFGYIRFKDGFHECFPVEHYLDLFDLAARHIQEGIIGNSPGDHSKRQLITGEASASTMWDNQAWSYLHGNREEAEPPFLAQDFIQAVQPNAKIIIMLRDPVERLYSDYLYFKMANKSAEDFHQKVRLNLGMYIVFLLDWLTVFHKEQILVLRLEDYAANLRLTIKKVFDFLSVGPLSEQAEAAVTKRPMSNTRRAADRNLGPMLPTTRDLLRQFHQPFNLKLAGVLDNKAFLWTDNKGQEPG